MGILALLGDHFTRLENKGVMTKRRALENKQVRLEFEVKEVKHTFYAWKILREIDKWNEKGFVDINEKEEKKKKPNENACPNAAPAPNPSKNFAGTVSTTYWPSKLAKQETALSGEQSTRLVAGTSGGGYGSLAGVYFAEPDAFALGSRGSSSSLGIEMLVCWNAGVPVLDVDL